MNFKLLLLFWAWLRDSFKQVICELFFVNLGLSEFGRERLARNLTPSPLSSGF